MKSLKIGMVFDMPRNYKPTPPKPIVVESPEGSDCWEVISHRSRASGGYPQIRINGKRKIMSRYIYEFFHGPIPDGNVVRHTCDNPACINPNHLICGTHADNVRDRVDRGRSAFGQRNGRSKLTEAQVIEAYGSGRTDSDLAREYGVDRRSIRSIRSGESYSWLTGHKKDTK